MTRRRSANGRREQLGRPPAHVRVREAVEAETAYSQPTPRVGNGVGRRRRRKRRMECGVEARDGGDFGRDPRDRVERGEAGGLVQRSHVDERAQVVEHTLVDDDGCGVAEPPVDDPVPDRVERTESCDRVDERFVGSRAASAPRSCEATTLSRSSTTRSLTLLEPALTTRMRTGFSVSARPRPVAYLGSVVTVFAACTCAPRSGGRPSPGASPRRDYPGSERGRSRPSPDGNGRGR